MYQGARDTFNKNRGPDKAGRGYGMMPGMESDMRNVRDSGYMGMLDQQQGGAYGDTSGIRDMLSSSFADTGPSNSGRMYQDIVGGEGNTYIDPMVDAMRTGSFENMDRTMGNNSLEAQSMGQGGSSRHAMQNSMTERRGLQDMNMNEMSMRAGAYDKDLDWKMKIAGQADANKLTNQGQMMDYLGGANQAKQFGMNQGGNIQNLGMGEMAPWMQASQGPWNNMNNYANIMGDPTVLSRGTQTGKSSGFNFNLGGQAGA